MTDSEKCGQGCAEYFVWLCRVWGIVTALVLWGIGIEVAYDSEIIGYYIIVVGIVMTLFEMVFLIHLLIIECHGELSQSFLTFWNVLLSFDNWRKGIFYIILSIFCLIHNFLLEGEAWLAIIAGTMLVMSGVFYIIKSMTNSELTLPDAPVNSANTYNRLDRSGEDLGSGSINNDMPQQLPDTMSVQSGTALLSSGPAGSLAEQDEIMEA